MSLMSTTLIIDLPDELAEKARSAAGTRPLADAVLDWITRGVEERPVEQMSDEEVLRAATAVWSSAHQGELSNLLADQRENRLTTEGRSHLAELMGEYRRGMLTKAKAMNEAVRRGLLAADGHAA
jgi:hypothetical protein